MLRFVIQSINHDMKTLLFLLLPLSIYSQSAFKRLDSSAFITQIDAVIKATGKDYVFSKHDHHQATNILVYNNKIEAEDELIFFYDTYFDDEDKNLEITGVKKWDLKSIRASYTTLFPVWQKYADPSAIKEKLSKDGYKIKGDYSFKELDSPIWLIRF